MTLETLASERDAMTLNCAIGSIEADESQLEQLDEMTERVESGEFHTTTDVLIICACVDGRCDVHGNELLPNSAGGTESIMVADDLTHKRFAENTDGSTAAQYRSVLEFLSEMGQPRGGYTAVELHGAPSGCGANDKLPAIYDFIATHGADLRRMAAQLGVELDDATHDMLVSNAVGRTQFSDGSELLNDLKTTPDAKVAELEGAHREVIVAVNTKFGTTLDREALRAAYPDLQAFNVDAWSFVTTARLLTDDPQEASELAAAMTYYNLATACVLAGKSMRVVVVK